MARQFCKRRRLLIALGLCTSILVLLAWPSSLQLLQGRSLSPQSSQASTPSMSLDSSHWERICRPAAVVGGALDWCPRLHQLGHTGSRAGPAAATQQLQQQLEQHPDKCAAALQMPQVATLLGEAFCSSCPACMACLAGTRQGLVPSRHQPTLCCRWLSSFSHAATCHTSSSGRTGCTAQEAWWLAAVSLPGCASTGMGNGTSWAASRCRHTQPTPLPAAAVAGLLTMPCSWAGHAMVMKASLPLPSSTCSLCTYTQHQTLRASPPAARSMAMTLPTAWQCSGASPQGQRQHAICWLLLWPTPSIRDFCRSQSPASPCTPPRRCTASSLGPARAGSMPAVPPMSAMNPTGALCCSLSCCALLALLPRGAT